MDFAADLARIHVEMIGGREKVMGLEALRAVGKTRISGGELSFVLWAQRPNRVRVETIGGEVRITRGYDGENTPWMSLGDNRAVDLPTEEAAAFIGEAEFDDPLFNPAGRGLTLTYDGVVTVDDRKLSRVRVAGPSGESTLYLDDSYMIVRRDVRRVMRGREVVEETHYSDFKEVRGVRLPHRIQVRVGNNILHETVLLHVDANPFLLSGFFGRP